MHLNQPDLSAAAPPPRWTFKKDTPHPVVPAIHLQLITSWLNKMRCSSGDKAMSIGDYLFGYAWALQDAGIIDRFQEGVISDLSCAALAYRTRPGFTQHSAPQGTPKCPDQT